MIPDIYKPASWRNTLPVEKSSKMLAIGFDVIGQETPVRLKIDIESARHLVKSIQKYLDLYELSCSQSERSPEIPRVPGSMPTEGQKV